MFFFLNGDYVRVFFSFFKINLILIFITFFIDVLNRIHSISTFYQTNNLEENRNLPGADVTPCTQCESSVKASTSDVIKYENIELNEKHAETPKEEPRKKEQCILDIDITKLEEVIKEYMKNDDFGFQEEYAVCKIIYACYLKILFHKVLVIFISYIFFLFLVA